MSLSPLDQLASAASSESTSFSFAAEPADQEVVTFPAFQLVFAETADQDVEPVTSLQVIFAGAAGQHVISASAI